MPDDPHTSPLIRRYHTDPVFSHTLNTLMQVRDRRPPVSDVELLFVAQALLRAAQPSSTEGHETHDPARG